MVDKYLITAIGEESRFAYANTEANARNMMSVMLDSGSYFRVIIEHIVGEEGCLVCDYSIKRVLH